MHSSFFFTFSALIASVATGAVINPRDGSPWTTVKDHRLVYQFANGTTIENIAVRSNGSLLVTLSSTPELYEVDPFNPESPKLVHHFSGYLALVGITEVSPDVFTLIASNFSAETGVSPGSWAVWQVAFQDEQTNISKVTDLPGAQFPNGMTTLETTPNTVIIADSAGGVVYSVNTQTGEFQVVLEDETFKAAPGSPLPIGVNGIRYLDHYAITQTPLVLSLDACPSTNLDAPSETTRRFLQELSVTTLQLRPKQHISLATQRTWSPR